MGFCLPVGVAGFALLPPHPPRIAALVCSGEGSRWGSVPSSTPPHKGFCLAPSPPLSLPHENPVKVYGEEAWAGACPLCPWLPWVLYSCINPHSASGTLVKTSAEFFSPVSPLGSPVFFLCSETMWVEAHISSLLGDAWPSLHFRPVSWPASLVLWWAEQKSHL